MKGLYFLFLSIFILRVAFAALPYDTDLINWYLLSEQRTTAQFAFWRLMTLMIEMTFIVGIMGVTFETESHKRAHCYQMGIVLLWIQLWYILEYCLHYTSVWITWEQLGFSGNGRSGLSSHIVTMCIFAYLGWSDD